MTTLPERFAADPRAASALPDAGLIAQESRLVGELMTELGRVIVGQHAMLERLLIGLLADGHVLLEGVPGLAKTLAVQDARRARSRRRSSRIQFTPDLLPGRPHRHDDLRPAERRRSRVQQGPIFANLLLADEINRAPAKVQSALLEAMQERQVTIGEQTYPLPEPFLVLATQNPIEHEGTYPLPEAQVDRFMFKLVVTYPERREEREVLDRMTAPDEPAASSVIDPARVLARPARGAAGVHRRADQGIRARPRRRDAPPADAGLADLAPLIEFGASPRAAIFLLRAAKAHAFIEGRAYVTPDDIKALGPDVLRHRVILTYRADAEGVGPDALLRRIFEAVPVP